MTKLLLQQQQQEHYQLTTTNMRTLAGTLTIVFVLLLSASNIICRRLERCELAGELYILDVPKVDIALWLCIAKYESRFNTHVIGKANADGSSDYGIFQISDKYWCSPENETDYYIFNQCNLNCSELITDDITYSVKCAKEIHKQQGWLAWTVYEKYCNDTLEEIDDCFQ